MPELLTPSSRTRPRATRARKPVVKSVARPRREPPARVRSSWLLDYATFLYEQQDNYCQGT